MKKFVKLLVVVAGLLLVLCGLSLGCGPSQQVRLESTVSGILSDLVAEYYQKIITESFGALGTKFEVKISDLVLVNSGGGNYVGTANAALKLVGSLEGLAVVYQFLPGWENGGAVKVVLTAVSDGKNVMVGITSLE